MPKNIYFRTGREKERHEIECSVKLWQDIVDTFGKDAEVMRRDDNVIRVKIMSVPIGNEDMDFRTYRRMRSNRSEKI